MSNEVKKTLKVKLVKSSEPHRRRASRHGARVSGSSGSTRYANSRTRRPCAEMITKVAYLVKVQD